MSQTDKNLLKKSHWRHFSCYWNRMVKEAFEIHKYRNNFDRKECQCKNHSPMMMSLHLYRKVWSKSDSFLFLYFKDGSQISQNLTEISLYIDS